MDSISQFLWGALSAEAVSKNVDRPKVAPWIVGGVCGTLPDLDSFFRSSTDPLFSTLMHRHFTHSIFFIPIGALIGWLLLFYFFRKERHQWLHYFWLCLISYGTHWILDVLTSYGTQIFWPVTDHRFAMDWMSIVDPLVTVPWLVAFIAMFFLKQKVNVARAMILFSALYFSWAGTQHYRGQKALQQIAAQHGHNIERFRLLPSLANSVWFRAVYLNQGMIHSAGILVEPNGKIRYALGEKRIHEDLTSYKNLPSESFRQLQIWDWFTGSWMFKTSDESLSFGDGRYTNSATSFDTLWALTLDLKNPSQSFRSMPKSISGNGERSPFEGFKLIQNPEGLVELKPSVASSL
ncbi:MAG: metal-dependent hydrolase [Bdellovibrionia bacterium]